jgi:hypothetical protein
MSATFPEIKASAKLPAIVAIVGVKDGGPTDGGYGSAICPHCGAEGRYVYSFICEDGKRRGAMAGCLKLFPKSNAPASRLVIEAHKRMREAAEAKPPRKLASWWQAMIDATDALEKSGGGIDAVNAFVAAVGAAERTRQDWLSKNGYGRSARRRR